METAVKLLESVDVEGLDLPSGTTGLAWGQLVDGRLVVEFSELGGESTAIPARACEEV